MTDLFFSPEEDTKKEIGWEKREAKAKVLCASCELRIACLEFALVNNEEFGIWGGFTQGERREFKAHLRKQGYRSLPVGQELQANVVIFTGSYRLTAINPRLRYLFDEYSTGVRSGRTVRDASSDKDGTIPVERNVGRRPHKRNPS